MGNDTNKEVRVWKKEKGANHVENDINQEDTSLEKGVMHVDKF
ncbi:28010_t:CDS:2 [Dentiscutata erythropus]|uniref:28010_t:CDS:1 n=1 Tax=Dentiscutata erythropus TaxID=1348616 RepID=A0A9N9GTL2_9GLOM|nr:28010_t:CDS:2 [Dentiscutata erythropus]